SMEQCTRITDVALITLFQSCPMLNTLNIKGCAKVTDRPFQFIGEGFLVLDITACDQISDLAIIHIARRCKKLYILRTSSRNITDKSISKLSAANSSLRVLELGGCELLTSTSVTPFVQNCAELEILNFNGCRNITDE